MLMQRSVLLILMTLGTNCNFSTANGKALIIVKIISISLILSNTFTLWDGVTRAVKLLLCFVIQ